jgi:hypothetical protein
MIMNFKKSKNQKIRKLTKLSLPLSKKKKKKKIIYNNTVYGNK